MEYTTNEYNELQMTPANFQLLTVALNAHINHMHILKILLVTMDEFSKLFL